MTKNLKLALLVILPTTILVLLIIFAGSYFWGIQSSINKIEDANENFYGLLEDSGIDVSGYVLYEEVFSTNGTFYLIFLDANATQEEGEIVEGMLLEIDSVILQIFQLIKTAIHIYCLHCG